jgi:glycogen debranching enzyme
VCERLPYLSFLILALGFSPSNTPHLTPALELDSSMIQFSSSLQSNGLPSVITSDDDINVLIIAFEKVVRKLNLWQYYVLDSTRERKSIMVALQSGKITPWCGPDVQKKTVEELADVFKNSDKINGLGRLASRFSVAVDGTVAAGFTITAFPDIQDKEALADVWVKIVDVLNVPLYREWEEDTKVAIANIRNRLKYARLDAHGPKLGEISKT